LIRTLSITQLKNSQTKTNIQINHDVAPPNSVNAVLTLANGQQIILDSAQHGQLATQANIKIIKSANNEISYQTAPGATKDIPNNTLTNPRGSKVATLTLTDGTRVWLNAGSSLTFPVAFTGKERTVSLTGEIYFEVAPRRLPSGQTMPFTVHFPSSGKEGIIQVLGTHFNVNAYEDEATSKVTLLEGAVNISMGSDKILLKPEQQALLYNRNSKVLNRVDINEVMAWKNGLFIFKGEDINTIMRQIERWYDVEVQYEKPVTEKFYLKMDRRTSVSNVFRILESTGGVHFKINGKKILVRP
jgi:transmembrane sensor